VTPRLIVALSLRLAALVWLLHTLSHIYGLFTYLNPTSAGTISKSVVWSFAFLQVAACGVLWFFPSTIAGKLLPSGARADEAPSPPRLLEWQTLGVICIGLWGLSRAIPDAIYWVTFYTFNFNASFGGADLDPDQKASMVSTVVELAISCWLIFGAKGFAEVLFKIRTAGVTK
jgi:hypothetical protein